MDHSHEPTDEHSSTINGGDSQNLRALTYHVPTMDCASCAMVLERLEEDVLGIMQVETNVKRQRVTIRYQPSLITEAAIRAAAQMEGYELLPIA